MTNPTGTSRDTRAGRSPVQLAALGSGIVFLPGGVLGFVPGVTSDYGSMEVAGHESHAMLLGTFPVSVLHDVVHLLFGGAGVAMARTAASATAYLVGGGIVYLLLWVYGLVIERDSAANVVPLNEADQWLHLVLAVALTGAGLLLGRRRGDERA
jgi:hypothetical protein